MKLTVIVLLAAVLAASGLARGQVWTSLGPAPTTGYGGASGRVSAVVCSPTDANRYYAAGADGGVWRTADGGATWTPLTDHLPTTAIGALALDSTNEQVVYAGSGEANFANHSRHGLGLYKSTDGGDNWTVLAAQVFAGRCFSRIIVHPQNPQIVYAAITQAGGFPQRAAAKYHPGAEGPRGVFRSMDGGVTWAHVSSAASGLPDLCATDLAMDAGNPSVLYVAIGHIFGDAANGIYRSSDGGETWTRLPAGVGGLPTGVLGRISLATAPTQPGRIYTLITRPATETGANASVRGGWRSDNGGDSWVQIGSVDQATYGWYLSVVAVHPTDANLVVMGGLSMVRSTNAGVNMSNITPPHVDLHAAAWDAAGRLVVGCDGGVYRSPNNGGSWASLNAGLSTIQFYAGISTSPIDETLVIGGTQDNGTARRGSTSQTWNHVAGGDGGWTQWNQQSPNIVFAESQGTGALYRSTNAGLSFGGAGSGISGRNCFLPPYVIDPNNSSRVLYGTERVLQSLNGGTAWAPLSADLTGGPPAAIRALTIAPADSRYVYAATNDGRVLSSEDSGATFTLRLSDAGNWPRVSRELVVDPAEPLTVYHAGWRYGPEPRLRRTRDGGANWERLDAQLLDVPINVVAIDRRAPLPVIYVGADDGVYRTVNDGALWRRYGENFPRTAVTDLLLEADRPSGARLVVGTQGRGAWLAPIVYCYPDMDDDRLLTVADFAAFLTAFAAGSLQANCDHSMQAPVLNIMDFSCFLQRFAAGCP